MIIVMSFVVCHSLLLAELKQRQRLVNVWADFEQIIVVRAN